MTTELTERQEEVLRFIQRELKAQGISPTVQEIQWAFGFKSPNAVQTHLSALTKKGFVQRNGRQARSLSLLHPDSHLSENGTATHQASPVKAIPSVTSSAVKQLQMGTEVFFDAKHRVDEEFEGELHSHSWRLRAVAMVETHNGDVHVSLGKLRQVLQEMVGEIDGEILNKLGPFITRQPTLERMATWLSMQAKGRLNGLGVQLRNVTVWDQPTRDVTIWEETHDQAA